MSELAPQLFLRVSRSALELHAAGDVDAIGVELVVAAVHLHLQARPKAYPVASYIAQRLGWDWRTANRFLGLAAERGLLGSWQAPVEIPKTAARRGGAKVVMATRYTVRHGDRERMLQHDGFVRVPLEVAGGRGWRLKVAAFLAHVEEQWDADACETTTRELATVMRCSERHVRSRKAWLRERGWLREVVRPVPGSRWAQFVHPVPLRREMVELDVLGAPILWPEDERARTQWSKMLNAIKRTLDSYVDGARAVQRAAHELAGELGEAPTARQVSRWLVRRYRSWLAGYVNRGHARMLYLGAGVEAARLRAEVRASLDEAALARSGAPPG